MIQTYASSHRQHWTQTILPPALVIFMEKWGPMHAFCEQLIPKERGESATHAHFFVPNSSKSSHLYQSRSNQETEHGKFNQNC